MKLHITEHKNSKLKGIASINTSSLINSFCNKIGCRSLIRKDRNKISVCELCYSEKNEVLRKALEKKLINNSKLLSEKLLDDKEIPFLNYAYVRFHSFGELINDIHMHNFYKIALMNPQTKFCLMTKRYDLVVKYPKLKNVIYIASSPIINKNINNYFNYFDKIFTVYSKEYANKNNIKINCEGRECIMCKKCYTRKGSKEINEILRK